MFQLSCYTIYINYILLLTEYILAKLLLDLCQSYAITYKICLAKLLLDLC